MKNPVHFSMDTRVPYASYPDANNISLSNSQYMKRMAIAQNTNYKMVDQKKKLGLILGSFVAGGMIIGLCYYHRKSKDKINEIKAKGDQDRETAAFKKQCQLDLAEEKATHKREERERAERERAMRSTSKVDYMSLLGDEPHLIDKYLTMLKNSRPEEVYLSRIKGEAYQNMYFGCVRLRGVTNIFGSGGIGKTLIALQTSIAYSEGKQPTYMSSSTKSDSIPKKSIIYASEQETISVSEKLHGYHINDKYFTYLRNCFFQNPIQLLNDICERLQGTNTDTLVTIDNVTSMFLHPLTGSEVRNFMTLLQYIIEDYARRNISISFLLVHHTNKEGCSKKDLGNDEMNGSSLWNTFSNSTCALSFYSEGMRILKVTKQRDGKDRRERKYVLKFIDNPFVHFQCIGSLNNDGKVVDVEGKYSRKYNPQKKPKHLSPQEKNKIIELADAGYSISDIAKKMNRNRDTVGDFIKMMRKLGRY